ncbi:PREDICTED: uncharacterized protein LOC104803026 [Tarenaya hassleriana]|uniref:uncharacterized protein LOC104803026 n=1 Tax=Tarenaya hassleriana TaxID=28532 RepID=UPI00053C2AB6|nr:PREDICTED: uncharacterized protein LOC104803026 [Tarenaya hassleriana]
MAFMVFRRIPARLPDFTSRFLSASRCVCSRSSGQSRLAGFGVETVDDDAWHVSSSLAQAWRETQTDTRGSISAHMHDEEIVDEGDIDHDEIDNLRIHGNLFYKIDRGSKEFEEYSFEFHRKKHLKTKKEENWEEAKKKDTEKSSKEETRREDKKKKKNNDLSHERASKMNPFSSEIDNPNALVKKKERTPTFNQITAPFHYPFCLDIYISKASVRASVIHRVTSKVVAVAHSISKDIKYDMGSTRNAETCAAVGRILAQRALEDDIHDIIYTPRRREKLEGKLQIVLQAIVDNGVNVKVKLKQRKFRKSNLPVHPPKHEF